MLAKITELEGEGETLPYKEQSIEAFTLLGIDSLTPKPRPAGASTAKKPTKKPVKKKTIKKKVTTK